MGGLFVQAKWSQVLVSFSLTVPLDKKISSNLQSLFLFFFSFVCASVFHYID